MRLEIESQTPSVTVTESSIQQPAAAYSPEARELLAEGIKAAQVGDRVKARTALLKSTELDARSESAWLWLASISEYPEELLVFLTNVLEINPDNQRAIEWTAATKTLLSKTFVQRGIDAVEEAKPDYAAQCFNQALEYDQNNSMAWLWMASLCDSNEGKITYFERVLTIDPENDAAQSGYRSARYAISQRQLAEARAAAVAGRTAEANEFLDAILDENPDSEDAWILRSHLAEGFEKKIIAFERVLQLNPENVSARSGLDSLLAIVETVAPRHEPEFQPEAASLETLPDVPESSETEAASVEDGDFAEPDHSFVPFMDEVVHDSPSEPEILAASGPVEGEYATTIESTQREHSAFAETAAEWGRPADSSPEQEAQIEAATSQVVVDATEEFASVASPEIHHEAIAAEDSEPTDSAEPQWSPATAGYPSVSGADYVPFVSVMPHVEGTAEAVTEPVQDNYDHAETLFGMTVESEPLHVNAELQPLSSSVVSVAGEGNTFSHVTFCAFCNGENDVQAIVCQTCSAVLTLSDLEMLISNNSADKFLLRGAVERMESERLDREPSEIDLTMLGIGHLNLQNLQYGFNYLLQASELNPNNVILGSQVNALRIRLEEIKRRDEVNETMPKGKKILVVDDSPTVRKLIAGKLEKSGHEVICASDGVEAMERLDGLLPDLVLLDITMPRMDGYQVCKLIRNNTATQNVPVVMISGKDGFFDKVRGRMAGTTGYITKPFGPETLMKAVETYLAQTPNEEWIR